MLFAVALLAGASLKEQPPYAPEFFTEAMLRAGNELKNGEFVSPDFVQLLNKHASLSATCSAVGDCGRAYQACCVAFGAKGYPCGCHLQDGSGEAGANCGDCGTAYAACCIGFSAKGYPCQCDVA